MTSNSIMKKMLTDRGVSTSDAEMIVDMAAHISDETMVLIDTMAQRVPEELYAFTVIISTMMIAHRTRQNADKMIHIIRDALGHGLNL